MMYLLHINHFISTQLATGSDVNISGLSRARARFTCTSELNDNMIRNEEVRGTKAELSMVRLNCPKNCQGCSRVCLRSWLQTKYYKFEWDHAGKHTNIDKIVFVIIYCKIYCDSTSNSTDLLDVLLGHKVRRCTVLFWTDLIILPH